LVDPLGDDSSGCRLIDGGSGPKSVGGSSLGELGTRQEWLRTRGFRLVQASESKTLRPLCGGIRREWGSPLEWRSRPPYMVGGLGIPFEVGGPSSGSITD
jgi:hypothetical protein